MKTLSPSREEGREHGPCIDELVKSLRLVPEVCVRDGFVKFEYATYSYVTEEGVSEARDLRATEMHADVIRDLFSALASSSITWCPSESLVW